MEVNISCCGEKAFIESNLPMWKNRIAKWAEAFPEAVSIITQPESNEGYVYASFPFSWLKKIKPGKQYSPEEAAELAMRLRRPGGRRQLGETS